MNITFTFAKRRRALRVYPVNRRLLGEPSPRVWDDTTVHCEIAHFCMYDKEKFYNLFIIIQHNLL